MATSKVSLEEKRREVEALLLDVVSLPNGVVVIRRVQTVKGRLTEVRQRVKITKPQLGDTTEA